MQATTELPTAPPLPGADLVSRLNAIIETLGTDFAGPDDPAAIAWPYATWADTANLLLKRRNAAGTAWVVERELFASLIAVGTSSADDSDNSAKLATTGWVRRAMSTIASAAGFAASLNPTGYIKFPSWLGGWIVQWGAVSVANGNYGAQVVFPIIFTNSTLRGFACDVSAAGAPLAAKANISAAKSSMDILLDGLSVSGRTCAWLAIGT